MGGIGVLSLPWSVEPTLSCSCHRQHQDCKQAHISGTEKAFNKGGLNGKKDQIQIAAEWEESQAAKI